MGALENGYYILDYKGGFYRVDEMGQLVMAEHRSGADVFTYKEANQRIGTGKKAHFYRIVAAEELEPENGEDSAEAPTLKGFNWTGYLNQFLYIQGSMKDYQAELVKGLSEIDQKICDIMHYIELYQETEEDDLAAVQLLRECREERRWFKDEMMRVEWFQKAFPEASLGAKVKESVKQIDKLEHRRYVPRKMPELFAGKEMVKREAEPAGEQSAGKQKVILSLHQNRTEDNVETEEEITMERVRKLTVLDGRENDWLAFAREQLAFFGNAKQYMINLELDLEQIDAEIADILTQIEDASYNVTQGYKVFKRLKDLRVERRAKDKELRCLEIITECFDCEYIEDAYRYSVGAIGEIMEPVKGEMRVRVEDAAGEEDVVALSV